MLKNNIYLMNFAMIRCNFFIKCSVICMFIFETKEDMAIKLSIFDIKVFGFLYLNLKKSNILQKKPKSYISLFLVRVARKDKLTVIGIHL